MNCSNYFSSVTGRAALERFHFPIVNEFFAVHFLHFFSFNGVRAPLPAEVRDFIHGPDVRRWVASEKEHSSTNEAVLRECNRYGLDYNKTILAQAGDEFGAKGEKRRWWDYAIVLTATAVFISLGVRAVVPQIG